MDFLARCLGVLLAWFVVLTFFYIINYFTKNLFGIDFMKDKTEQEKDKEK